MMPTAQAPDGPNRTGSNRSEVWKYFTETVGGAKCKLCGQLRVRSDKSTKTMHDHLRTAHKDVSYQKAYPNRRPQRLISSVKPPKSVSESKSVIASNLAAQARKVEIEADRHILYLILRCMADFDVVLGAPELAALVQVVYPTYKLKSRPYYGNVVAEREAIRISSQFSPLPVQSFFSLSADWLTTPHGGLVTLSSHLLNNDYHEVSGVFMADALGPSTSELDVAERLRQRLRDLNMDINRLVAIVHSGEFANISRLLNVHRLISRVMQSALKQDSVQLMVAKARLLIENYKKYSKTKVLFHEKMAKQDSNWVRICEMLTTLVSNAVTVNSIAEELGKKDTGVKLSLDEEEAEVFSQLSVILLTFKDEAVRLSRDSASAYFPTFLKLKSFVDSFSYSPGGVVEVFVTTVRREMSVVCEAIRCNKFLVLCSVLDPRFRARVDYQALPWGNIEGEFLDFALSCVLKLPMIAESREKEEEASNQNFNQFLEFVMQSAQITPPSQSMAEPRQPLTGTNNDPAQENDPVHIKSEGPSPASSPNALPPSPNKQLQAMGKSARPVDIWQSPPAVREEHDLNFRLSFSVTLKCELDQFAKIEPVDRCSSVTDWWLNHSNEFPRLRRFAQILHSIPATAICSRQLFGGEAVGYSAKLLKWFGNNSSANCLLVKSHLGTFKRLPHELEPTKSEDDS